MFECLKRKIALLTALVTMLTTVMFSDINVSAEVFHLEGSGYYSYEINNDQATITFYQLDTISDTLTIPTQIDGYTVVEIGEKAFFMQPTIKEVTVPESVQNIGSQALGYVLDIIPTDNYQGYIEGSKKIKDFIIKGYIGTVTETYAKENGFTFIALDEETVTTTITTIPTEITATTVSTTVSTSVSDTTSETAASATTSITTEITKISGDADNDNELTVRDCAYIASMLANGESEKLPETADFNGDGIINVRDAAGIAKKLAENK